MEHGRVPDQAEIRAQVELFRTIPGLEKAEFARLGGLHRNSFIRSPELLDHQLRLKSAPHIRFAGQITGCEGYVESAAIGLIAARFAAAELGGRNLPPPPGETALGALLGHITGGADAASYQPMNVNFGLFPPLAEDVRKKDRKLGYTARAGSALAEWIRASRRRRRLTIALGLTAFGACVAGTDQRLAPVDARWSARLPT